jgi:hypothetical protein
MDQLKPVIEFFKKQYFWVLIGVVTLMSIASWWMTTSSLSSQLKANTASLDTKYNSVKEVASKASTHPNSASHEKMDAIAVKLAEDVGKAWELQYNRQVKLMQWPANELGQDFVDRVEKYRPIESLTFPLPSGQDPLGLPLRERYRDYVDPLFPRLAKIIGANWTAATKDLGGGGSGGGMAGMGGEGAGPGSGGYGSMMGGLTGGSGGANAALPIGSKYLVNWDETAQKQMMQNVLWWHNANKAPSTLEILYTQEDLWILEGLMNIIKSTNGDAQENFQAAIKKIEFIRIGKQAVGRAGEISGIASTSSMTGGMNSGMPGMEGSMEGMPGGSSGGGMPDPGAAVGPAGGSSGGGGEGGEGAAAETGPPDPASGRYVDTAFQPIEGEKLRSVVTSGALDPTDAPLAVAKRVPVRMRFIMDQRKVNRLLAECGNADLMLEIRQVRINTAAAAAAGGGMGGMGGGMGALFGGGGSPSASGMGGPSSSSSGGSASADMGESGGMMGMLGGGGAVAGSAKTYDLPVEIWGVVYMFNPVDMNKLGLQNVTAETQLENVGRVDAADSTAPTTDPVAPADGTQPAAEAPAAGVPAAAAPAAEASGGAVPAAPAGAAPAGGDSNAPAAPGAPAASSPTAEAPAGGAPAPADGGAGAATPAAGAGSATAPGT